MSSSPEIRSVGEAIFASSSEGMCELGQLRSPRFVRDDAAVEQHERIPRVAGFVVPRLERTDLNVGAHLIPLLLQLGRWTYGLLGWLQWIARTGSLPTTHASCPGGTTYTVPGVQSNVVPSSISK